MDTTIILRNLMMKSQALGALEVCVLPDRLGDDGKHLVEVNMPDAQVKVELSKSTYRRLFGDIQKLTDSRTIYRGGKAINQIIH